MRALDPGDRIDGLSRGAILVIEEDELIEDVRKGGI